MKNWHWIVIGAVVGAVFSGDYALAGLGIGMAAGTGIMLG